MDKATVIALRKEFHHLTQDGRANSAEGETSAKSIDIPLLISIDQGTIIIDEYTSCIIWDDDAEVVYSICANSESTDPLLTICPMRIKAFAYEVIMSISARVDLNCMMEFFDNKIADSLTSNATKERYRKLMMDMNDPRSYTMGQPSTTTTKGPLNPSEEGFNLLNPRKTL